ncbi:hypothetical protein [Nonomuraea cavernae]|uniref:hypothetical protein n=1 Tax=Nonomuraea cavernae TaxID=2045107 RepID=UPI0033D96F4C
MMAGSTGYLARWGGLRRRAAGTAEEVDFLEDERRALLEVFAREGNPMGHDHYGVELEKRLAELTSVVFEAFDAYIDDMEQVRDGLRVNATTYEAVELPPPAK